jgi:hypothetical protein
MSDERDVIDVPGLVVNQGVAMMRIENETMTMIASQKPRNEKAILDGALAELELYQEQAKAAFYSIPYKDREKGTVYVQGPSIGAAMALARRWGNCNASCRLISEDENGWTVSGVFIDYESNFRVDRPHRASKWMKLRDSGKTILLDDKRQLMAFQASVSKAVRNAVIDGLPAGLVSSYFERARAIVGGKLDAKAEPKRLEQLLHFFGQRYKITKAMLEAKVGRPMDEWLGIDVANLRGLGNALFDGQETVETLFGDVLGVVDGEVVEAKTDTVTADDLANGKVVKAEDQPPETGQPMEAEPIPEPEPEPKPTKAAQQKPKGAPQAKATPVATPARKSERSERAKKLFQD